MSLSSTAAAELSLVLKCEVNPTLFSPAWFLHEKLVGHQEYNSATVAIINTDLAVMQMDWLNCQFRRDTIQISTENPEEYERLRDVMLGVLYALDDLPVYALGVNRVVHFETGSKDAWHAIGDQIMPKNLWDKKLILPGMKTAAVMGVRPDNYGGNVNVTVEPSNLVKYGIFVSINDHFELRHMDSQPTSRSQFDDVPPPLQLSDADASRRPVAIEILTDTWRECMNRADDLLQFIEGLAK